MPIKDPSRYPADWPAISARIRSQRAAGRCEWCGAENGNPHPITGGKVVLTVAHLNHNPADCRDENLAALCQKCHNTYDRPFRNFNRRLNRLTAQLAVPALPARVPSSLPMTVAEIRAETGRHFPGMVIGYDAGFGFVLGYPAPRKTADDYRVDIDHMITPCHTAMKMTPRILVGGTQGKGLTAISEWLRENTVQLPLFKAAA